MRLPGELAKHGLLGALFGDVGVDMNQVVKQANAVNPMTVDAGLQLQQMGLHALDVADGVAKSEHLPGQASRDRARARLNAIALGMFVDPLPDDVANEVKGAFEQALVEFNAAAEGNATLAKARAQLYQDLIDGIENVPRMIGQAVGSVVAQTGQGLASGLFSTTAGTVLTIGAIGVGGWLLYDFMQGKRARRGR